MVNPRLLNYSRVTIEKTDKAGSQIDHLRREPVNRVKRVETFEINAQVVWMYGANAEDNKPSSSPLGVDNPQTGYLVVKSSDLAALGKTIERGDRVLKLGPKDVILYVTDANNHSFYTDRSDFTLQKISFADRISKS